jgi:hypothetical protein
METSNLQSPLTLTSLRVLKLHHVAFVYASCILFRKHQGSMDVKEFTKAILPKRFIYRMSTSIFVFLKRFLISIDVEILWKFTVCTFLIYVCNRLEPIAPTQRGETFSTFKCVVILSRFQMFCYCSRLSQTGSHTYDYAKIALRRKKSYGFRPEFFSWNKRFSPTYRTKCW